MAPIDHIKTLVGTKQGWESLDVPTLSWRRNLAIWMGGLGEQMGGRFRPRPKPSDAILLAGSGRSGTTWLAALLASHSRTQVIFEPENPSWTKEVRPLTGWGPSLNVRSFYITAHAQSAEWFQFWERALSGGVRNGFTDRLRTSWFPNRYLVKVIRANLMLGYIYDNFRPMVVYCMRHPCAVVASRIALGWVADVRDILAQETLVEDHLRPWLGLIEREKDGLGAQAVWWAVENMMAMKSLEGIPHRLALFERLCLAPENEVTRLRRDLRIRRVANFGRVIARPSSTSNQEAGYQSAIDRLSQWKRKLDNESQRRILAWAHRLGVVVYDTGIAPIGGLRRADEQCFP